MSRFLIIGGGISGCTAGSNLAEQGHEVTIVETTSIVGGKVLEYCCKATDECSRCGVCIAHTQIYQALSNSSIRFITGACIDSFSNSGKKVSVRVTQKHPVINTDACNGCDLCVEKCPENCITKYHRGELVQYTVDYQKCRIHKGQDCSMCLNACPQNAISINGESTSFTVTADAILVATGHDPFDANRKPRLRYGRSKNIFTGAEVEEILTEQRYLTAPKENIAFIQCVGSRDPQLGRNYCSAVCCSYALRIARMLTYRNPETKITIYYIDIQNFDKTFTSFKKQSIDLGVTFHRGLPFTIEELSNGKLQLLIENTDNQGITRVLHDAVVLSVGLGPTKDASEVATLFGLKQDQFGFFGAEHPNMYVSGTCKEPMSIPESVTAAKSIAHEMGTKGHDTEP